MLFLGQIPVIRDPGHLYEDYLSFIPALKCIGVALRRGELPLWSPFSHAGMVLFADPQYTITYPVSLICYLLPTQLHFAAVIVGHMLLGAVALYFLMRRLRVSRAAALFASVTYAFSFPVVFSFLLINAAWPWHWLPLILLLVIMYLDGGSRKHLYALALVWGLQMFTYIQSTYVMLFLLAPFTALSLFAGRGPGRGIRQAMRRLFSLTVAVCLGTLMASALLIPLWEYQAHVSYKAFGFEEATIFPLPAGLLLESFLSGRPWDSFFAANWCMTFYVGAAGIILALYALALSPRRKMVLFLSAVAAVAVILALGAQTPLYRIFYSWAPGAKRFHAPVRFLWLLPITLSLLAGFGMDRLASRKGGARNAGDYIFFGMVFALILAVRVGRGYGVWPFSLVPISLPSLCALVPASLAVTAVAFARIRGFLRKGFSVALLAALSIAESQGSFTYLRFIDYSKKYATPETVRFLKEHTGLSRFFSYNRKLTNYAVTFPDSDSVPMVYPELANYFGLYDIQARGPLRLERYDSLIKGINRHHEMFRERGAYHAEIRDFLSPIVDLFGVKYIVSKGELEVPCEVIYQDPQEIHLRTGESVTLKPGRAVGTRAILLSSFLEGAAGASQGEVVAEIALRAGGVDVAVLPVRAGIHTAEVFMANDPARRAKVMHARPEAWDTWEERDWDGNSMTGAHFRGVFELKEALLFDTVTVRYRHGEGVLAVTGILYLPERRWEIAEEIRDRFTPVFRDPRNGIIIYENRKALPRAFLADSVVVAGSAQQARELLLDGALDLSRTVIIEEAPPPSVLGHEGRETGVGDAEIIRYSPNRVEIRVRARRACMLFLSDTYYPGWEATVDGTETKIYKADYAFRGVFVPAGEHDVVMRFRPRSVMIGGAVSLLALIMIVFGFVRECRKTSSAGSDIR